IEQRGGQRRVAAHEARLHGQARSMALPRRILGHALLYHHSAAACEGGRVLKPSRDRGPEVRTDNGALGLPRSREVCVVKGRLRPVDYLAWAQTVPAGARWNLTASGVPDACGPGSVASGAERERQPPGWPLLGKLEIEDLCRRDKRPEILAGFLQTVAERYDVAPECVVPTVGSSGAITQILFALARPGDHVIVERPTFEPLHRVPEMLGLSVSRLERKFEERWEPLPDRLARLLTPKPRAVILSSLHHPAGVAVDSKTLAAIGEMAARVGAAVLIDEVYLDFDFHPTGDPDGEPRPWRPAAVAIDNGVSWSS